ncbi:MAG TPA: 5'-3' exonuclease H3TH domain-containing protein [Woeseiaceae bacterium]|nr:5'-3' exonuclease H3TH domain-containing protein [Woeseiaceae bacterium]|tara:strand:- start:11543 stop:12439 length:897 start_codon:yes stop_codon:yes gene_type:complete
MQYLIDASVYIFRAHYSMPEDIVDGEGNPINAFYGFCRFIGDFLEKVKPNYIAVLFDESHETSFRSEIYPLYKANREPAPPELKKQFVKCKEFVDLLGLMSWSHPRYEADDLIGTLVRIGREEGRASTILSRDKDLAQLIGKQDIFWDYSGKGKIKHDEISDVFGVRPEQVADYLALAGDSVDNISGAPGVGKKTAIALLQHFEDLQEIYKNLDKIHEVQVRGARTLGAKLEEHYEKVILSRKLTGIDCYVGSGEKKYDLITKKPNIEGINKLYDHLSIGTALRRQAERIRDFRITDN